MSLILSNIIVILFSLSAVGLSLATILLFIKQVGIKKKSDDQEADEEEKTKDKTIIFSLKIIVLCLAVIYLLGSLLKIGGFTDLVFRINF